MFMSPIQSVKRSLSALRTPHIETSRRRVDIVVVTWSGGHRRDDGVTTSISRQICLFDQSKDTYAADVHVTGSGECVHIPQHVLLCIILNT